jgi:hypothetical protein
MPKPRRLLILTALALSSITVLRVAGPPSGTLRDGTMISAELIQP